MEIKNINLIPEGDKPIIHASQFDENRSIRFDLKDGVDDYTLLSGLVITCNIKKVDGNIVTFDVENTESTYVVITLPLQATACAGPNIGEIVISYVSDEDNIILGTVNFILEVEKSPMLGGIESASDIHDLEEQIEVIVTQIIATDYYTKLEVNTLLADKADISDLPDMDNYYDKSSVDTLLNGKANVSDLDDYYNKTQVDNKLDQKADISDLPDMTDYYTKTAVDNLLSNKADITDLPDMSNYYTKTQIDNMFLDIMPVNTIIGAIASFDTLIVAPLVGLKTYIVATGGGGTPTTPIPIVGVSDVNVTRAGKNLADVEDATSITTQTILGTIELPAGNYTMSADCKNNGSITCFLSLRQGSTTKALITINANENTRKIVAFTLTEKATYSFVCSGSSVGYNFDVSDIQIEVGATVTDYEPYNPQSDTFTLPLGQTVYGGYVDWELGKLVATHAIVDMGSLTWSTGIAGSIPVYVVYNFTDAKAPSSNNDNPKLLCDIYTSVSRTNLTSASEEITLSTISALMIATAETYADATAFKNAMVGHKLVYELATPIEISLPTTMPQTIQGVQNWFADSGDIDISFKQDIQNYVDSKISALSANRTLSMVRPVTTEESKGDEDER